MKTTRHSLMAKGILVLLSLLVLVFVVTYSWYTNHPEVSSSGISGSIESTGDFEYAIGFFNNGTRGVYKITPFTNQTSALNLERIDVGEKDANNQTIYYNLLHDYKPIDVTGDGRTLIRPAMSYGNSEINIASNDYSIAEPNVQYISFDLYFRSQVPGIPVNLGSGSWAKGGSEVNGNNPLSGNGCVYQSTYGIFSKDAIVGAVRVAFIPYIYTAELNNIPTTFNDFTQDTPDDLYYRARFIWLPRPELHLNPHETNGVEDLTGWTLTTNSTDTDDKVHRYYNIFPKKNANGETIQGTKSTVTYDNTITPESLTQASQNFSNITTDVKYGDYYYPKVNVRIWIEGTDAEARRATSGGSFELNFQFKTTDE